MIKFCQYLSIVVIVVVEMKKDKEDNMPKRDGDGDDMATKEAGIHLPVVWVLYLQEFPKTINNLIIIDNSLASVQINNLQRGQPSIHL